MHSETHDHHYNTIHRTITFSILHANMQGVQAEIGLKMKALIMHLLAFQGPLGYAGPKENYLV